MTRDHAGPPRLARWLLRRVLDGAARSAILGDLDEEFTRFVVPRLGARAARRWYWRRIHTFDAEANGALSQERMLAGIGWGLGIAALILLVIGLYGTTAAAVIRSRRELGIRLALGAKPQSLRILVVGRCLGVAGLGLAMGLPLAYVATKSFAHLLYGVRPMEPTVASLTIAMVVMTATVAGLVPARRAARVDPEIALRAE